MADYSNNRGFSCRRGIDYDEAYKALQENQKEIEALIKKKEFEEALKISGDNIQIIHRLQSQKRLVYDEGDEQFAFIMKQHSDILMNLSAKDTSWFTPYKLFVKQVIEKCDPVAYASLLADMQRSINETNQLMLADKTHVNLLEDSES